MAITLLSRSLSTEQLHGVLAEIVGAILNGIDKCEASYEHDFVLVLGVRGEERIEVGPFVARRMRSRSPELTSVAATVVEGCLRRAATRTPGSTLR